MIFGILTHYYTMTISDFFNSNYDDNTAPQKIKIKSEL